MYGTEHARREADVTSLAYATWESRRQVDALVAVLARALRGVDPYTAQHSRETADLAVRVAQTLSLDPEQVCFVSQVASLHDIGKVGIPSHILLKPGLLDPEELALMRSHPEIGERIVRGIPALADLAMAIRHEHERWDGCGYPDGLAGEQIPLASRIVFVCDAWHAMTSDRPYRSRLEATEATRELESNAGTQFDPAATHALLSVLRREVLQSV